MFLLGSQQQPIFLLFFIGLSAIFEKKRRIKTMSDVEEK
jgi:hypothetical protein